MRYINLRFTLLTYFTLSDWQKEDWRCICSFNLLNYELSITEQWAGNERWKTRNRDEEESSRCMNFSQLDFHGIKMI